MPLWTIETTYRLPVYRHKTYEAETLAQACRLATEDDDWQHEKPDRESAGETYVTGIWSGEDAAHSGTAQSIPSHYTETYQRIAKHFEVLLGLVKVLATPERESPDPNFWRERAQPAIAKAESILAGARDPVDDLPSHD
jgi:hypothetical protein